jgi:hypothetical protein
MRLSMFPECGYVVNHAFITCAGCWAPGTGQSEVHGGGQQRCNTGGRTQARTLSFNKRPIHVDATHQCGMPHNGNRLLCTVHMLDTWCACWLVQVEAQVTSKADMEDLERRALRSEVGRCIFRCNAAWGARTRGRVPSHHALALASKLWHMLVGAAGLA